MSAAAGKNNDDILFQSLGNLISHEKILVVVGIELHSTTPKQATLRRTIIQGRIIVKYFFFRLGHARLKI